MLISDQDLEHMLQHLQTVPSFDVLCADAARRRVPPIWYALDRTLCGLRHALYADRLRKAPPRSAAKRRTEEVELQKAVRSAFHLLEAFARLHETQQVIITTHRGWPCSVSFQPRPWGMNWTAEHAITFADPAHNIPAAEPVCSVTYEDLAHLAVKAVHAATARQLGKAGDMTATISFVPDGTRLVVRNKLTCAAQRMTFL